jgi:hypothetical protein
MDGGVCVAEMSIKQCIIMDETFKITLLVSHVSNLLIANAVKIELTISLFFIPLYLSVMDCKHGRKNSGKSRQRENPEWFTKSYIRSTRKRTIRYKQTSVISDNLTDIMGNSSREGDTIFVTKDLDWWTRSFLETQSGISRGFALSLLPEKGKPSKRRQPKYSKHFPQ